MSSGLVRRQFILSALSLATSPIAAHAQAQTGIPIIAAASDLQFALPKVSRSFTTDTGNQVRLTFGSTGNFARQIREGAPFQLFMAADESYIRDLAADGHTRDTGTIYGLGRIVMITPAGSSLSADGTLESLRTALSNDKVSRFAIANPDHAPYGVRARQALQYRGLWDAIKPRLVLGENVSQAAQFALSGSTQGGIIAYSLALSDRLRAQSRYSLIPLEYHAPLNQRMVLLKSAGPTAEEFYDYLQSAKAMAILQEFGFAPRGDS